MSELTVVSLFDGIGGFLLSFQRAGARLVASCEIDTAAAAVSERHFPDVHQFPDVTELKGDDLTAVGFVPDRGVITAGFPCQDLSIAGKRAGLAGARSGLWWDVVRLLDETRSRWFLGENVPGLLSSNGGRDMGAVLGSLGELGYGFAYRVLDAQWFGVPQRRRRVFIVGHLGEPYGAAAEVLFEFEGSGGDFAAGGEAGAGVAGAVAAGAGEFEPVCATGTHTHTLTASASKMVSEDGTGRGNPIVTHVDTHTHTHTPQRRCRAAGDADTGSTPSRRRGITSSSWAVAALTSNGVGTCGADDNQAQAGHLIPTTILGGGVTHSLTNEGHDASEDGTGRGTPIVAIPILMQNAGRQTTEPGSRAGDSSGTGIGDDGAASYTITSTVPAVATDQTLYSIMPMNSGTDYKARAVDVAQPLMTSQVGGNQGGDYVVTPLALRGREHGAELEIGPEGGPQGSLRSAGGGGSLHSLVSIQSSDTPFGVAENQRGEIREGHTVGALSGGNGKPGQGYQAVREGTVVRRLTELECERLQGYPDGWTDGQAGSARYRQLGNSVAVPVVEWIARRLTQTHTKGDNL